jgi:hypothetical protein
MGCVRAMGEEGREQRKLKENKGRMKRAPPFPAPE